MAPTSVANSIMNFNHMPETPTGKQSRLPPVHHQMRDSAEKFNRHNRLIRQRQRSPPVPESELNTSKLAIAFPGFSGVAEDIKPFSPNPFLDRGDQDMDQGAAPKKNLDVKRQYHARVRDENDVSILSPALPPLPKTHNRNTRFGPIHLPKIRQAPQPHMYTSAPGLMQNDTATTTAANVSKPMAINAHGSLTSVPNGSTQQTLNLPQGSNLTDIFSGVVRQPPPVDSQPARPRASRFTSSKPLEAAEPKAEEITVPAHERHLLRSIDTLQARVAELEKLQVQWEATNSDLEQKTLSLQIQKKELEGRQRRDSTASSAGSGNENVDGAGASYGQLANENKELQAHNRILARQNDSLAQEVQELEQECNQLRERAAKACSNVKNFRDEFARLGDENDNFGQQHAEAMANLAAANSDIEALANDKHDLLADNQDLRDQISMLERDAFNRGAPVDWTAEFAKGPDAESSDIPIRQYPNLLNSNRVNTEAEQAEQAEEAEEDEDMDSSSQSIVKADSKAQHVEQHFEQSNPAHGKNSNQDSSYNITYVSYAGASGSCGVRKDLENERKARHQLRKAEASQGNVNATAAQHMSGQYPRETSSSSTATTKMKHHNSFVDRTSSLLLENFTLTLPLATNDQAGSLPATVPAVLPLPLLDLAPLDVVHNATQQSDPLPNAGTTQAQHTIEPAQKLTVSDEELDITIQDEEPTERPSQPPAAALAAVLESVRSERALQLSQLAKYQASYSRHDTALNRRQRKQLHAKIVALTESVDRKADQIYNLHDLVADQEQQKSKPMNYDEVDHTLQSLGLELPWQGIASSTTTSRSL
ncbi:MAG: hypothetical protein Q9169_005537 [Polycauliona sp. 2 TL-2023]